MDNDTKLSTPTIVLHWLIGIVFIIILAVGFYMVDLPKGPDKGQLYGLHKSFGFLFLFLALVRVGWRFKEGAIAADPNLARWQHIAAKSVQHLLLLFTLVMPITGMMLSIGAGKGIAVFGFSIVAAGDKMETLQSVGHFLHTNIPILIVIALGLHILAALKHHFIDKDATLKKMLGKS